MKIRIVENGVVETFAMFVEWSEKVLPHMMQHDPIASGQYWSHAVGGALRICSTQGVRGRFVIWVGAQLASPVRSRSH